MERKISEMMTPMPHTIGHDISVTKARNMMEEYKCNHLPVLDGGQLVGVISERDLRLASSFSDTGKIKVEELMTDEPFVVESDEKVKDVITKMLDAKVGSAIVTAKADQPWGIFTQTDALKLLVALL